jgi:hypothetical protein
MGPEPEGALEMLAQRSALVGERESDRKADFIMIRSTSAGRLTGEPAVSRGGLPGDDDCAELAVEAMPRLVLCPCFSNALEDTPEVIVVAIVVMYREKVCYPRRGGSVS